MPKRDWIAAISCAALLTLGACEAEPEDATVGEPPVDTLPITGTGSDLPEGMPLPATPEDTLF